PEAHAGPIHDFAGESLRGATSALRLRRRREEVPERPEGRLPARLLEHLLGIAQLVRLARLLRLPGALDHREADAPLLDVELHDRDVDGVADRHDLPRMRYPAVERQPGDVHEAVETRGELHEGAELLEPPHRAGDVRSDGKAFDRRRPGIRCQCTERQPHAATAAARVRLELHDLRLDPLADLQHLGGVRDARVAELTHVDEAIDAAEVDEDPEVADRADRAADDGAHAELRPDRPSALRGLLVEQLAARHDDVPAARLELRDPEAEALADVDRSLGLAADGDEGGGRANRDHPPADDVPGCDPPLALAPLLARREKRGKVLLVVGRRHGFALLYPATRRDAIRAC